tara:strand:- start:537 stop:1424 length:888 start_codon:yes stop_codon:yes gene_type:complete
MSTETQIQIIREDPAIEAYKLGLLGSAKSLADKPITLPTQQIAAMSGLQSRAITDASPATGGIGGYQPYLQEAGYTTGDAYQPIMDATKGITGTQIAQYMNPYQQAVQAEIDRSYNIQLANARQQAVGQPGGPSAFGGSRAAIQEAEINRNRASALAQAQAQNFMQAQQAATGQLDRGIAAGDALGTLGLRQASMGELAQKQALMDIETQFNLGKQQQGQQQAEIEAKRQSDLAQLYEPYQRYGFLSDIYKGAPTSQQSLTSATAPNVSPAQQYLGLGIAGLSAAAGAQKAGLFG